LTFTSTIASASAVAVAVAFAVAFLSVIPAGICFRLRLSRHPKKIRICSHREHGAFPSRPLR
jgi:hypothetical protein